MVMILIYKYGYYGVREGMSSDGWLGEGWEGSFQFNFTSTWIIGGITSKGPWRSSKVPGIQLNAYLKEQGLCALRDGWIRIHHAQ
jgi:RNA-directed DNA polymerase